MKIYFPEKHRIILKDFKYKEQYLKIYTNVFFSFESRQLYNNLPFINYSDSCKIISISRNKDDWKKDDIIFELESSESLDVIFLYYLIYEEKNEIIHNINIKSTRILEIPHLVKRGKKLILKIIIKNKNITITFINNNDPYIFIIKNISDEQSYKIEKPNINTPIIKPLPDKISC